MQTSTKQNNKKNITKNANLKAQASLEYLMIAGFLLIIIGIVFFYSNTTVSNSIDDSKARNATDNLRKAIDQVYALGPGSKITVTLDLPGNIQSTIIENKLVGYVTSVNGNVAHYYADTKANLRGEIPITEGSHQVTLQVNEAGEVIIGEDTIGLTISPKTTTINVDFNTTTYNSVNTFTLWNKNTSAISGITITTNGTMSSFITIGTYEITLDTNQQNNFSVTINVPNTTPIGTYSGYLEVDSNNGTDRALIQIVVSEVVVVIPSVCTGTGTCLDTNWETSWTVFDANMKGQYQLNTLNTQHWHNPDINWNQLQNYPASCPTGYAIQDINSTAFTCIHISGNDTNWQTSWTLLDANIRATYVTIVQTSSATFFDDFDGSTVGMGWTAVNSGTGAAESLADVVAGENTMGVLQWSTGTTATGRAALIRNTGATMLGQGKFDMDIRAKVPTLSVVAQEFSVQLGLHDATTKATVDGVYFHYDRAGYANDQIRCVTGSNGSLTTNNSGVTIDTAWNKYEININAAGTQVLFYINGTLVCTNTTNIPTTALRVTSPRIQIIKSAGTTARTLLVDYWQQDLNFTTTR
jgi:uncharacterized protein (UPF0333 family)